MTTDGVVRLGSYKDGKVGVGKFIAIEPSGAIKIGESYTDIERKLISRGTKYNLNGTKERF